MLLLALGPTEVATVPMAACSGSRCVNLAHDGHGGEVSVLGASSPVSGSGSSGENSRTVQKRRLSESGSGCYATFESRMQQMKGKWVELPERAKVFSDECAALRSRSTYACRLFMKSSPSPIQQLATAEQDRNWPLFIWFPSTILLEPFMPVRVVKVQLRIPGSPPARAPSDDGVCSVEAGMSGRMAKQRHR